MRWNAKCIVKLVVLLAALACTAPAQAFSFCFSFGGNNNHRYNSNTRYPPPYPPAFGAYYPPAPYPMQLPSGVYAPAYPAPSLQSVEGSIPASSE